MDPEGLVNMFRLIGGIQIICFCSSEERLLQSKEKTFPAAFGKCHYVSGSVATLMWTLCIS